MGRLMADTPTGEPVQPVRCSHAAQVRLSGLSSNPPHATSRRLSIAHRVPPAVALLLYFLRVEQRRLSPLRDAAGCATARRSARPSARPMPSASCGLAASVIRRCGTFSAADRCLRPDTAAACAAAAERAPVGDPAISAPAFHLATRSLPTSVVTRAAVSRSPLWHDTALTSTG